MALSLPRALTYQAWSDNDDEDSFLDRLVHHVFDYMTTTFGMALPLGALNPLNRVYNYLFHPDWKFKDFMSSQGMLLENIDKTASYSGQSILNMIDDDNTPDIKGWQRENKYP